MTSENQDLQWLLEFNQYEETSRPKSDSPDQIDDLAWLAEFQTMLPTGNVNFQSPIPCTTALKSRVKNEGSISIICFSKMKMLAK
jgi:hypothetical protein